MLAGAFHLSDASSILRIARIMMDFGQHPIPGVTILFSAPNFCFPKPPPRPASDLLKIRGVGHPQNLLVFGLAEVLLAIYENQSVWLPQCLADDCHIKMRDAARDIGPCGGGATQLARMGRSANVAGIDQRLLISSQRRIGFAVNERRPSVAIVTSAQHLDR